MLGLKLLLLTHSVDRHAGGVGSVVCAAANAFKDNTDWEVIVVCINRKRYFGEDVYGFFRAIFIILIFSPNIVHQHGIWNLSSLVSRLVRLILRNKLAVFPHGMLAMDSLKSRSLLKELFWKLVECPNIQNCDLIWSADEEQKNSILPNNCSFVVHNPIPNFSSEIKIKKTGATDTFLYLGRLDPKKNIIGIINEFRKVSSQKDVRLVIAGDGEPEYTKTLFTASEGDKRIRFTGFVTGKEKTELLRQADFGLFNSEHEGLQITLVECCYFYCVPIVNSASNARFLTNINGALEAGQFITASDFLYAHNLSLDERETISKIANAECKRLFSPERYVHNIRNIM